jgi:hypothetical protein
MLEDPGLRSVSLRVKLIWQFTFLSENAAFLVDFPDSAQDAISWKEALEAVLVKSSELMVFQIFKVAQVNSVNSQHIFESVVFNGVLHNIK